MRLYVRRVGSIICDDRTFVTFLLESLLCSQKIFTDPIITVMLLTDTLTVLMLIILLLLPFREWLDAL
jgi:hypothetical protein